LRFPHRARSRRPNPEPASLIAPVVSSSARLLRIDPKCFPRSMAFCLGGRSAPFFAPDRFSAAHARKPSQPFKSRRALSRLKEESRVFRSVRENASGEGRVVRAARARLYTRGRARRTNVRATTFLSRHASSAFLADMSADEPFAPESSRRRRDPARTTRRLSASTSAAAYAARAFLVAAAAVSAGAQSLSAQGGMYYPYGSAVGPLYGYARRPRRVADGSRAREPSSPPRRTVSLTDVLLLAERRRDALNPSFDFQL